MTTILNYPIIFLYIVYLYIVSNISYVIMTARKKFVIDKKAAFEDCYEIYHDAKFNGSLLQLNEDL